MAELPERTKTREMRLYLVFLWLISLLVLWYGVDALSSGNGIGASSTLLGAWGVALAVSAHMDLSCWRHVAIWYHLIFFVNQVILLTTGSATVSLWYAIGALIHPALAYWHYRAVR